MMKRRKLLVGLCNIALLCSFSIGCSSKNSNIIECSTIYVKTVNGTLLYTYQYYASYDFVYEYSNLNGNCIYANLKFEYLEVYNDYDDSYNADISELRYYYKRFVGFLLKEENYYFNIDNCIIDHETKWSEYTDEPLDHTVVEDNAEAFKKASKEFYVCEKSYYSRNYYFIEENTDTSLSRHEYISIGDNAVFTYVIK